MATQSHRILLDLLKSRHTFTAIESIRSQLLPSCLYYNLNPNIHIPSSGDMVQLWLSQNKDSLKKGLTPIFVDILRDPLVQGAAKDLVLKILTHLQLNLLALGLTLGAVLWLIWAIRREIIEIVNGNGGLGDIEDVVSSRDSDVPPLVPFDTTMVIQYYGIQKQQILRLSSLEFRFGNVVVRHPCSVPGIPNLSKAARFSVAKVCDAIWASVIDECFQCSEAVRDSFSSILDDLVVCRMTFYPHCAAEQFCLKDYNTDTAARVFVRLQLLQYNLIDLQAKMEYVADSRLSKTVFPFKKIEADST